MADQWANMRGPVLTPRDSDILRWLGRHGLVTAEQIQRRFFAGERAAYRRIHTLGEMGLIRRDPTYYRQPYVLRLTMAGARVANAGVGPAELVLAAVRHSLALVELTERLVAQHPGATLITEREFRARQLRALREGTLQHCGRIPDGLLVLSPAEGGTHVALELDLTPKRAYGITRVIDAYNDAFSPTSGDEQSVNAVWWFVAPATIERVRAVVHEKRADDFITVQEWQP